jgi:hypothetical protein
MMPDNASVIEERKTMEMKSSSGVGEFTAEDEEEEDDISQRLYEQSELIAQPRSTIIINDNHHKEERRNNDNQVVFGMSLDSLLFISQLRY